MNRNIFKIAVIVGIIILPLIYSVTYLKGFWDPYNNLGNIKVAIVNNDSCDSDCKSTQLIKKLKQSDSFYFIEEDSSLKAEKGLHNKKYYAVVTVPEDFTSSFDKKEKSFTTITYRPNNKTNYIASQLISNALLRVEKSLQSEVSKKVVSNLSDKLKEVPASTKQISDGMGNLASGTTLLDNSVNLLSNGTGQLQDSYYTFNNGINKINDGINKSSDGINTLNGNSKKIKEGIGVINSSLVKLKQGTSSLNNNYADFDKGVNELNGGLIKLEQYTSNLNILKSALPTLKTGSNEFSSKLSLYKQGSDKALDDAKDVYSFLINYYESNPELANDKSMTQAYNIAKGYISQDGLTNLKNSSTDLVKKYQSIDGTINAFSNSSSSLDKLISGINKLSAGSSNLVSNSSLIKTGISNINSGVNQLQEGSNELNNSYVLFDGGMDKLSSSSNLLVSGLSKLSSSSLDVMGGINKLNGSTKALKYGTKTLDSKVKDAKSQIDDKLANTNDALKSLNGLSTYVANPVKIKEKGYGNVNDYGTFFSPFFISLSLWLGSLIILIGLYYDPEDRFRILGRNSENRKLRIIGYLFIGIIQAFVLGTVLKISLDFSVTNLGLFYGTCILISLAFSSIMMFLIFNFNDVGKFIAIVLLVVQLAACGGTFPLEVEPNFFGIISPFMPMTYSVEMLRESFVSIEHSLLFKDLIVLLSIIVIFGSGTVITEYIKNKKEK